MIHDTGEKVTIKFYILDGSLTWILLSLNVIHKLGYKVNKYSKYKLKNSYTMSEKIQKHFEFVEKEIDRLVKENGFIKKADKHNLHYSLTKLK